MAAPKGLNDPSVKSLLKALKNKSPDRGDMMGLAIEGQHYVKRRKGETQEEFEKRKKAYEKKMEEQRKRARESMKEYIMRSE